MPAPTEKTYGDLNTAYDFFNARLFEGKLPGCLITMQRRNRSYGFFVGDRFAERDSDQRTDEIALNPSHFHECTVEDILSTLVHEMTHLEQHHFGKPSRRGYHNKEWAGLMKRVGLYPSSTGEPGGKEVGQKMSHYIVDGDRFQTVCAELMKGGVGVLYVEKSGPVREKTEKEKKDKEQKNASKTKFSCPQCGQNAWAKPDAVLVCGICNAAMEPDETEEGEGSDGEEEAA
jgi:predicted SprT family Zn-dependent metalloprotease